MRTRAQWIYWCWLVLLVAAGLGSCEKSRSRAPDTELGDTAYAPPNVPGPVPQPGISARTHGPIERYAPVPPPLLSSLPPLIVREGCLAAPVKKRAAPPMQPAYVPSPRAGTGYGSLGVDGRGAGGGASGAAPAADTKRKGETQERSKKSSQARPAAPVAKPDSQAPAPARSAAMDMDKSSRPAAQAQLEEAAAPTGGASRSAANSSTNRFDNVAQEKMRPADEAEPDVQAEGSAAFLRPPLPYEAFGASIYLSNDDTMSLSSAQRIIYSIDKFLPLPAEYIRPHELLNYFSFETDPVAPGYDFSVRPDIAPDPRQPGVYTMALAVRGRALDKQTRRSAALTFVIDRSGSMRSDDRMNYLQQGLRRMMSELKTGDMVHLVAFDHQVCTPIENFVVGRDDPSVLTRVISKIKPRGSTDLLSGLTEGYRVADGSYQTNYNNRVLLITDALANRGETNPNLPGIVSRYYESRKIRLSGVGVGREFNDALLDRLTEKGKGAYVFLGSEAEVDAVFGGRFLSLIETTALDVHFRLHLPRSMKMNVFYGEESSTVKSDVQAIHYFANTSQLFLSDLASVDGALHPEEPFAVTIEYSDPETGLPLVEEYVFNVGQAARDSYNIRKARLLMAWVDLLSEIAGLRPGGQGDRGGQWIDGWAYGRCTQGKTDLGRLAAGLESDPETRRVMGLWDQYCSRFDPPRNPMRRVAPRPQPDAWPSATGANR